jgi:hypothetical protein
MVVGKLQRPHRKRGQTAVEYLLLMAVVVGVITVFQQFFVDNLVEDIEKVKLSTQSRAWKGGAKDLKELYRNGCGKSNLCR